MPDTAAPTDEHVEGKQQDELSPEDRALANRLEEARKDRKAAELEREDRTGTDAVKAAASPEQAKRLTDGERVEALDWFLSDDVEDYTHEIELNVGSPRKPKWITWRIRPVDMEVLRRIRKASQAGNRQQRRAAAAGGTVEIDEVEANLRIAVEGTIEPDLKGLATDQGIPPIDLVRNRFRHKPGLVGQIAGEIMGISGYDDEDVREVEAAGNS